jgi:serine/threonine protein kinase
LEYSHKSDIFGIGVVFYEMLHGYMPWDAVTQKELLYRMKKKNYTVNEELMLSDKSKAFLERALDRNVETRMDEKDLVSFFRREKLKFLNYQKQQKHVEEGLPKQEKQEKQDKLHESMVKVPQK